MIEQLLSSFAQVLFVLILSLILWGFFSKFNKNNQKLSYSSFVGLNLSGFQFSRQFFVILLTILVLACLSTLFQFFFIEEFVTMTKNQASPYWRILEKGLNLSSIMQSFIYCIFKAGLSEELLFRGLIAKRLFSKYGYKKGNIIQAFIFWLLHFLLVGGLVESWFSLLQLVVFLTTFPISLMFGFANEKVGNGSVFASWIIHASMNFMTFFLLAALYA